MPLYDVRCPAGHTTEVFVRGASAPLTCKECGQTAEKIPSVFSVRGVEVPEAVPETLPNQRRRPKYIKRAGDGVAYKNSRGNYRPAISHHTRCPNEKRQRNVAVLGTFPYGLRLNCEACGWQWIHQEATAPDPLVQGIDRQLSPGQKFSAYVAPGDRYEAPERGA